MSGMIKFTSPSGWDFGTKIASSLKISSRGLIGNDRQDFLKQASASFVKDIDNIKFAKDEYPVHLIALGSSEFYGCFVGKTPFALSDGRYIPINSVNVGDHAYTADGNIGKVSYLFKREVAQTLKIDVCGLADKLHCSLDHPFRVARKEQFSCSHDKYKRCLPPIFGKQNICNRPKKHVRNCILAGYRNIQTEWTTADNLTEGDFLVWTAPKLQPLWNMSEAEGYLLGAWLAKGCYTKYINNRGFKQVTAIQLATNKTEHDFQSKIKQSATSLGLNCVIYLGKYKNENTVQINISGNPEKFRLWKQVFGEYSKHKRIPPWVCCLPKAVRLAIVAGYIDGDGTCTVDEKENRTTVFSAGLSLSLGFQRLCWSLGFPAVRCAVQPTLNDICDSLVGNGWHISIANSYMQDIEGISYKVKGRCLKQTTKVHGFFHEGKMYLPVRSIELAGAETVFNLEVDGDHTYSGPNIDSHNCNRNGDGFKEATCKKYHDTFTKFAKFFRNHKNKPERGDPYYGTVKASAYNDEMHRVELICGLNMNKEAADRTGGLVADTEVEKLAKNEDFPVSMACHVPYDTCSYCGNQARTRDEYCTQEKCAAGGCRDNLARLMKVAGDLHHLHVDNPTPRWFDISRVFRPADRIAYGSRADYLTKAASDESVFDIQEYIKFASEATAPLSVILYNSGEHGFWKESHVALIKLANALSMYRVPSTGPEYLCLPTKYFPVEKLASFGSTECNRQLAALADQKIILSLTDFANLVGKSDLIKMASSMLPDIYSRKIQDESLLVAIEKGACDFIDAVPTHKDRLLATTHRNDFSLDYKIAQDRLYSNCLRSHNVTPAVTMKTAAYDVKAESLATQYALYKLAALWRIAENDTEFPLTTKLSIYQNQIFV